MIDTVNTKGAHYIDGGYRVGSGEKVIILLGSCRIMSYANYLDRWNRSWSPQPFTIFVIYVVNFTTDVHGNPTDCEAQIDRLQQNPMFMEMVKRCRWFIHEHVSNYGLLNTSLASQKNVFELGLHPEVNICIPNFNDVFILENDYRDCGVPLPDDYISKGEEAVKGFCHICSLSSFPRFAEIFKNGWRLLRYFWRPNHTSAVFTTNLFTMMNDDFLHLPLTEEFWNGAMTEDLFKNPHTEVTQRDVDGYRLQWR